MNLVEDLKARGLIEQSSKPLEEIFSKPRTVYLGTDPSADSLHAGNLLVILLMRRLAEAGNRIILLVGGGTGMIGDPKEKGERNLLDLKTVARNKKAIRAQMQRMVGVRITLVDNYDWLSKVKLLEFLRDIGKYFSVNEMTKRDLIKRRLENPDDSISYTEFTYSLLQAYDYLVLNEKYGCDVQVGGNDQWTNLLSGTELIRRKAGSEASAITIPLVTDSSGKKFGKSEGNAIWLDAKKTSPADFYQFWINQPDSVVDTYLRYFTFISIEEIEALIKLHQGSPERRVAQKRLAQEVTRIVHGQHAVEEAERVASIQFKKDISIDSLSTEERAAFKQVEVAEGTGSLALVAQAFGVSNSEARRRLEANAIKLDGQAMGLDTVPVISEQGAILQSGKKEKVIVVSPRK